MEICDDKGLQCISDLQNDNLKCLAPCKGYYADVRKQDYKGPMVNRLLESIEEDYNNYKRGFSYSLTFPHDIKGNKSYLIF